MGSGTCLGVPCSHLPASLLVDGTTHLESTICFVKVLPLESADLTPPQAGGQLCVEEVVPEVILSDRRHECIQLRICQNLFRLAGEFRRWYFFRWIPWDQSCLFRCIQCLVEHGVDTPDSAAGQPFPCDLVPLTGQDVI